MTHGWEFFLICFGFKESKNTEIIEDLSFTTGTFSTQSLSWTEGKGYRLSNYRLETKWLNYFLNMTGLFLNMIALVINMIRICQDITGLVQHLTLFVLNITVVVQKYVLNNNIF